MKLALTPLARSDIDEIWRYVFTGSGSEEIATRLVDKLRQTILRLRRNPRMGRSRSDDLGGELRSLPREGYVIFYRIDKDVLRVIRVLHGSRDARKLLM